MGPILRLSHVEKRTRLAIFRVLVQAAYADQQLTSEELSVIARSLNGFDGFDESDLRIPAAAHELPETLDEDLVEIQNRPGDLASIVLLLVIEVICADGVVLDSELHLFRQVVEHFRLSDISQDTREHFGSRLSALKSMRSRQPSSELDHWLCRLIEQLNTGSDRDSRADAVSLDLPSGLQAMLSELRRRKLERRLKDVVERPLRFNE